jgi:hypothetical protein
MFHTPPLLAKTFTLKTSPGFSATMGEANWSFMPALVG